MLVLGEPFARAEAVHRQEQLTSAFGRANPARTGRSHRGSRRRFGWSAVGASRTARAHG